MGFADALLYEEDNIAEYSGAEGARAEEEGAIVRDWTRHAMIWRWQRGFRTNTV